MDSNRPSGVLGSLPTILEGGILRKFLWYGIIFSIVGDFINVLAPILLWTNLSRHFILFSFIVMFYLPFTLFFYPILFITIFCIIYTSIRIFKNKDATCSSLLFAAIATLFFDMVAMYFYYSRFFGLF